MTEQDVLKLRDLAEHTAVQLKERLTRDCRRDVAEEMVCMSNGHGGLIVIGINDKTGVVNPLSFRELQETNAMLSAMSSDNVVPGISFVTENVEVKGGAVVVVTVRRGQNIPYRDNKGVVWVKNAGDKKRVMDNDEIAMMMAEGGSFRPDMVAVPESGIKEFVVTFARPFKDDESDRVGDRDVRDNSFNNSDVVSDSDRDSDRVDDRVTNRVPYKELTGNQKDIIQFCTIPRSAREILSHIRYSYHSKNMATFIHPLVNMGYLEMLFPDKPNSGKQKYRKVERKS